MIAFTLEMVVEMFLTIFLLLVVYQVKHFVADYPLQGEYILQKFKPDWGFFIPLLVHAGIHGAFTVLIVYWIMGSAPWALGLGLFDLVIHFFMDRIKAGPKYLGRYKALAASEFMALKKRLAELEALDKSGARTADDLRTTATERQGINLKFLGNKLFWWALGADQGVHHLTHYAIIFVVTGVKFGLFKLLF